MENMLGNSFCAADKKLSTIDAPKDHRIISMMKKNNFTPSKQVKKTLVMVWVSGWVS